MNEKKKVESLHLSKEDEGQCDKMSHVSYIKV